MALILCVLNKLFQNYYKLSYGYDINRDMSCSLMSHIFQQMDEQIIANRLGRYTTCQFNVASAATWLTELDY